MNTILKTIPLIIAVFTGCARTDFYFPPGDGRDVVIDGKGRVSRPHNRAIVLNGTDSLGPTTVSLTRHSLEFSSAGGLDNSTSTKAGYRVAEKGIDAITTIGVAGIAAPVLKTGISTGAAIVK